MFQLFILGFFAGVAVAAGSEDCPWILGKDPYDPVGIEGDWYLISGIPTLGETRCTRYSVKNDKDTVLITVTGLDGNNNTIGVENFAKPIGDIASSNQLGVFRPGGIDNWSEAYIQTVVSTDYDNYAIVIACKQTFNAETKTFGRHMFADILGRRTSLPKEALDVLKSIMSGYDIDVSQMLDADHTDC